MDFTTGIIIVGSIGAAGCIALIIAIFRGKLGLTDDEFKKMNTPRKQQKPPVSKPPSVQPFRQKRRPKQSETPTLV